MGSPEVHLTSQSGNKLKQGLKAQEKNSESKQGRVSADCGDITHRESEER